MTVTYTHSPVLGRPPPLAALPSVLDSILHVDRQLMQRYRELQAIASTMHEAGGEPGEAEGAKAPKAVAPASTAAAAGRVGVRALWPGVCRYAGLCACTPLDFSVTPCLLPSPPPQCHIAGAPSARQSAAAPEAAPTHASAAAASAGAVAAGTGALLVVAVDADGIADAPAVVDGVLLRRPRLIQAILTRKERGVAGVQPMTSWL